MSRKQVTELDKIMGRNLRAHRMNAGFTLEKLASELGITHQQLQKVEAGVNRLAASRLFHCSYLLNTTMEEFFDINLQTTIDPTIMYLVRNYNDIENESLRKGLRDLSRILAEV